MGRDNTWTSHPTGHRSRPRGNRHHGHDNRAQRHDIRAFGRGDRDRGRGDHRRGRPHDGQVLTDGGSRLRPAGGTASDGDELIRVLLVGDGTFPSSVERQLRDATREFAVDAVASVDAAQTALDEGGVDCVVADYDASSTDGLSLLSAVRDRSSHLPFIFFTDSGSDLDVSAAIEAGATDFYQKRAQMPTGECLGNRIRHAVVQRRVRKQAEHRARIAETVREVGRILVRARSRSGLFQDVCETFVDAGHCVLAWVGEPDPETDTVEPLAVAGASEDYVEDIVVRTDGGAAGRGPIGRALRSHRPQVTTDIETEPSFEPWREEALAAGLRSSLTVPLTRGRDNWGVLTLYADEPGAFSELERRHFVELADDIAHALHRIQLQSRLRGYREAVKRAGHTIYLTDRNGVIQWVNPAFERVTGYEASEVVGENASVLKSGVHGTSFYQNLWGTILDGEVWRGRIINRRKDGDEYVANQTIAPIENEDGEQYAFVAVNADVTGNHERIRSLQSNQRRLTRRNERLRTFADSVAHDLRDPLTIAAGNLQLAREGDTDRIDTVAAQIDRMNELVDSMLDLAKRGKDAGDLSPVSLAEAAEEAWRHVSSDEATLSLDVDPDWELMADESRLVQLLENLFRNSVEHGGQACGPADALDPGSEGVRVTVGRTDGGFSVADDGPGFPEDVADDPWTVGVSGSDSTGIGLALVKRIANGHGWSVSLESDVCGCEFAFRDVETASD